MRLRIFGRQVHRFTPFSHRAASIALFHQRVRQIDVRLRKSRFDSQRAAKLRDGSVYLPFRQQNPTERVVSFWAVGRHANHFFEGRLRRRKILSLQSAHTLRIEGLGPRRRVRFSGRLSLRAGQRSKSHRSGQRDNR